ncbi:amine oxidase catalytic domain-containing protein [Diaporthe amygdali]|uniref:amine oxidase catalytic domain-containing protein n=1 Tax=Phomopsis amygdali TaxID=1214568 RepID=UPI0022FDE8E8|nr:amine oxidase catalytic domain-containing protein [Diaporthe amygdali]KAJ0109324.1 amine oxidase catalytic domain-containing protein [Diaporthe amygdali]
MRRNTSFVPPILGFLAIASTVSGHGVRGSLPRQAGGGVCQVTQPTVGAPHRNIWAGLTNQEMADALDFLYKSKELNLTIDGGSLAIDLLQPNKTDVLPFLAGGGIAPPRYARATLAFGSSPEPYIQEYIVGPMAKGNQTQAKPLTFLSTRQPGKKLRVYDSDSGGPGDNLTDAIMSQAADITKALWNMDVNNFSLATVSPSRVENGLVIAWQGFTGSSTGSFDTGTLLPQGLYVRTDRTGRDSSKWKITGWLYNNVFYNSIEEFKTALTKPGFEKLGMVVDGSWAQLDKVGDSLPFDELPPPMSIQPGPKRFSVDTKENFVSWMDFSFYVTVSRDMGLRLFDIKYKGKRIIYELGMEEAIAHYAGIDPIQSGTCYFDTMYGFGTSFVSLVNGYDCPAYSTYINTTYMDGTSRNTQPNAICMFELNEDLPIQRHSGPGFTSITKSIAFKLRSVATVGNYDYQTTYEFRMDGSITVAVRASGYIQSGYAAKNGEYGFNIHDNLSGSMHDHVLTFKADFDIMGEKNSVQKVEFVPTTETYVWSDGKPRNTMKAKKSFIANEDDSKINWSPNGNAMYAIVNKDAKNQYGEAPGYRIMPAAGVASLTIQNSSVAQNAVNHADHHLYVTKQKDTEARAANPYNLLDPADPVVNFAKYFNGESLDQQDVVVWFNLGMHHMPHTGDLPNTVFSTAHSAITIEPFNYLPGDPSRATTQQVRINSDSGGNGSVTSFGAKPVTCSIDSSQLNPKVEILNGTLAVHKLPYDGTRPNRIG